MLAMRFFLNSISRSGFYSRCQFCNCVHRAPAPPPCVTALDKLFTVTNSRLGLATQRGTQQAVSRGLGGVEGGLKEAEEGPQVVAHEAVGGRGGGRQTINSCAFVCHADFENAEVGQLKTEQHIHHIFMCIVPELGIWGLWFYGEVKDCFQAKTLLWK